jgi:hypothetical protein
MFADAERLVDANLKTLPRSVGVLWRSADIKMRVKKCREALNLVDDALNLDPTHENMHYLRSRILRDFSYYELVDQRSLVLKSLQNIGDQSMTIWEASCLVSMEESVAVRLDGSISVNGLGKARFPCQVIRESELPSLSRLIAIDILPNRCVLVAARPNLDINHQVFSGRTLLEELTTQYVVSLDSYIAARVEVPQQNTWIFSIGRCGSSAVFQALKSAGVPVISEPAITRQLKDWRHFDASPNEFREVVSIAIASQLEDNLGGNRVVKLQGAACFRPQYIMRPIDRALFIWREPSAWFSSYYRMTLTRRPERDGQNVLEDAKSLIDASLRCYDFLSNSDTKCRSLSYEEILSNSKLLGSSFSGTVFENHDISLLEQDSQLETELSRDAVQHVSVPSDLHQEFMRWVQSSPVQSKASELGVTELLGRSVFSVDSRAALPTQGTSEMEKRVLVLRNLVGSSDHYFHFLFGVFLPFAAQSFKTRSDFNYLVPQCAGLEKFFSELPGWTVNFLEPDNYELALQTVRPASFAGLDTWVRAVSTEAQSIAQRLLELWELENISKVQKRILLVERLPKTSSTEAITRDERRSLENIDELELAILDLGDVKRVSLESLSLVEKARAFREADVVVAQHGAGLANLIFSTPSTSIVEICPYPGKTLFEHMANSFGNRYVRCAQLGPHGVVNPASVRDQIMSFI